MRRLGLPPHRLLAASLGALTVMTVVTALGLLASCGRSPSESDAARPTHEARDAAAPSPADEAPAPTSALPPGAAPPQVAPAESALELDEAEKNDDATRPADARAWGLDELAIQSGSGLDRDLIRRSAKTQVDPMGGCADAALRADPRASGKIVIEFVIETDGEVGSTEVVESSLDDDALSACVVRVIEAWTFPKPANGEAVTVRYPLELGASLDDDEPRRR